MVQKRLITPTLCVDVRKMTSETGLGEEIEDVIIQALSHRERRNILKIIESAENGVIYSGILGETGLSTGRLNYHLKELEGFIERDDERRYHLTALGKKAVRILRSIRDDVDESYQGYVTVAKASRRSFIQKNLSRAFYVVAVLLVFAPLAATYMVWLKPHMWWTAAVAWAFYFAVVLVMDRVRKKSPKYILGFINWLEWRLYGSGKEGGGIAGFSGSRLVVGLIIGIALGAIFNKIGAGILLGLFIGAAMEI